MNSSLPAFREPNPVEKIFNRIFGFLVGLGLGFSYNYLLQVRGRKSGKLYSTPIDLLEYNGKRYLERFGSKETREKLAAAKRTQLILPQGSTVFVRSPKPVQGQGRAGSRRRP